MGRFRMQERGGRSRRRLLAVVVLGAWWVHAVAAAPPCSPTAAFVVCRPAARAAPSIALGHRRCCDRDRHQLLHRSPPPLLKPAASMILLPPRRRPTALASTEAPKGMDKSAAQDGGRPPRSPSPSSSSNSSSTMSTRQFLASLALGLLGAGAAAGFLLPAGTPAAPLAWTLLPFLFCLTGGLPQVGVGSWKAWAPVLHRLSGVGTLLLPVALVLREALTSQHAPAPLYYLTTGAVACNLLFSLPLIPARFPAYDIPAARGLAVGSLQGLAFLGWSLTFRIGACAWYGPLGRLSALVALYGVVFSWSDALQNLWCWAHGRYKRALGRKWSLPFEPSSFRQVFFHNLYRQPTAQGLQASIMTAPHGALPTLFVALFGSVGLLQLAYLAWGPASAAQLTALHPQFARWATYQSLLAVAVNSFAVFLVSLTIHGRMSLRQVAFYNTMVPLAPLLNILAFCLRYPGASFPGMVRAILEKPEAAAAAAAAAAATAAAKAAAKAAAGVP